MSNLFVVSDLHLNHRNMLNFTKPDGSKIRDFSSIEEMNETIIDNWNRTVGKNDTVWNLGDVFFGTESAGLNLVRRLNGNKNLIIGNHDKLTPDFISMWNKIELWRKDKKLGVIMSHMPLHPNVLNEAGNDQVVTNLHGHIHEKASPPPTKNHRWINVCVEWTNYTPISYDEILKGNR